MALTQDYIDSIVEKDPKKIAQATADLKPKAEPKPAPKGPQKKG
jgi:hypothetical protein